MTEVQIRPWKAKDLKQLLPLLSVSYGAPVSYEDEWAYFQSMQPEHWQVALKDNKAVACLRDFEYAAGAYELEFACEEPDRWTLFERILKPFLSHHPYHRLPDESGPHCLRYCLLFNQKDAQSSLKKQGFVRTERFLSLKYHKGQQPLYSTWPDGFQVRFFKPAENMTAVEACLRCFGNLSLSSLQQAAQEQRLVVLEMNAQIVGAAFQLVYPESIEILQFAILPELRGKGLGKFLAQGLCQLYDHHFPQHGIALKVKGNNFSAIQLYKNCGFIEHSEAHEIWLYKDV